MAFNETWRVISVFLVKWLTFWFTLGSQPQPSVLQQSRI